MNLNQGTFFVHFLLLLLFYNVLIRAENPTITPENLHSLDIKIGIYSGTFDPPTKAHNAIIRSAIEKLGLEKLYIFVNKNGEKDYKCSSRQRVEMLQRMLTDLHEKVVVIAQASDNKRSDYLMIKNILNSKLLLISGEDSYRRRLLILPENRVSVSAIAIIPRLVNVASQEQDIALEPNVFFLPLNVDKSILATSSTKVREQLANKNYKNIGLTPEVLSYIIENSLYNPSNGKKEQYLQQYCIYIGSRFAPCPPPAFDPLSSEDSWQEKFYKWVYIQNQRTNKC